MSVKYHHDRAYHKTLFPAIDDRKISNSSLNTGQVVQIKGGSGATLQLAEVEVYGSVSKSGE